MANTTKELLEELKVLASQDLETAKDQIEGLKAKFYRMDDRTPEDEAELKQILADYRAERQKQAEANAAQTEANEHNKSDILSRLKELAESETADVLGSLKEVRELQARWKEIGAVSAQRAAEYAKRYNQYLEQFYDLVKIDIELREMDLKKNLESKTHLIEEAERLTQSKSVVEANRRLQQLHEEWAKIGPVAREIREEIWNRFKTASTAINKAHQAYFDELHAAEQQNLERKQALIAKIKELAENAKELTIKQWDELAEQVKGLQAEWRTIGFAPRKNNQAIFDEFRAEIDAFFQARKEAVATLRAEAKQRHQEYLERQAERERKHEEYLQRQAEREARAEERKAREEEHKARQAEEDKRIAKMKPSEMWDAIADKWKVTKK